MAGHTAATVAAAVKAVTAFAGRGQPHHLMHCNEYPKRSARHQMAAVTD